MIAVELPSVRGTLVSGLLTLVVLGLGFGTWATLGSIAGAVIARGQVEVESSRLAVQHPIGGRVAELMVEEGQEVAAGEVLLRLDSTESVGDLAAVESRLAALLAERTRLQAEQDGAQVLSFPEELAGLALTRPEVPDLKARQEGLFASRQSAFRTQIEQLALRQSQIGFEIAGLDEQTNAVELELGLLDEELLAQKQLFAKRLTEASRVNDLEREIARLHGTRANLSTRRAEAEARRTDTELESVRLQLQRLGEATTSLHQIDSDIAILSGQRRTLRTRIQAMELVAPVSGVVLGLRVTSNASVLPPAEPALYIIPTQRPLIVEARISPADVDEVSAGQTARLRILSYDSRQTADIVGTVSKISADVLLDQARTQSYYRAEIEIPPSEVARFRPRRILPGMPVEVFLESGSRTPLSYLTEPLTTFLSHSMRH
jgi:HlyD family secretion protein